VEATGTIKQPLRTNTASSNRFRRPYGSAFHLVYLDDTLDFLFGYSAKGVPRPSRPDHRVVRLAPIDLHPVRCRLRFLDALKAPRYRYRLALLVAIGLNTAALILYLVREYEPPPQIKGEAQRP
jgi:hypothetical protein